MLARLGVDNVFAYHTKRYPRITPEEILQTGTDLVVLPDEPYRFTAKDGPESFPVCDPHWSADGTSPVWPFSGRGSGRVEVLIEKSRRLRSRSPASQA